MFQSKIEKIRGRKAKILGHEECYKTAVLIPLVDTDEGLSVVFEKRASTLRAQPGEICFPGGSIDSDDENPFAAAIRETCEELGISEDNLDYISPLDIMVSPFNIIVYPYLAYIKDISKIKPNPQEVDKILIVPLQHLIENAPLVKNLTLNISLPDDYPYELIPNGKKYPFRAGNFSQHFYFWQDEVIWGLTARILQNFLTLLNKS